ncbi:MAG TPA: FAD-dependent oxidoreductase [Usitatibacter sp.]|nr:FAD-dependent oxidoreductase [Usitatibacter sp.]
MSEQVAVGQGQAVRILGSERVANATLAVRLSRPAGFTFKAGQSIELLLPRDAGVPEEAGRRTLSLASAPHEPELVVATRLRESPFKKALAALQPGAAARIEGPFGSMVLHKAATRDALFVAGGIGITPFRAMLLQAMQAGDPRRFTLLYSNRQPADAPWLAQLQQLERAWPRFRLVATMTELPPGQAWSGERRLLDGELVRVASEGLATPVCYIAGPPGMMAAARTALAAAGIDEDDVRGEEFFGY